MRKSKEKKEATTLWNVTTMIDAKNTTLEEIQKVQKEILKPRPFWSKKIPIEDILMITQEVSHARKELWGEVYETYPETLGKSLKICNYVITQTKVE